MRATVGYLFDWWATMICQLWQSSRSSRRWMSCFSERRHRRKKIYHVMCRFFIKLLLEHYKNNEIQLLYDLLCECNFFQFGLKCSTSVPRAAVCSPLCCIVMHRLFFQAENCKRGKIQIHKKWLMSQGFVGKWTAALSIKNPFLLFKWWHFAH